LVSATGVQLEIKNALGDTVSINSVNVTNCGISNTQTNLTADASPVVYTIPCSLTSGNTFRSDVIIKYTKTGTALELKSSGTIAERVE
jgi:hypothetical protein